MTIPAWTATGVLPPIRPGALGDSPDRSPYPVDLLLLVDRFAISPERRGILDGLLRFRSAFHQAGIVSGFQWLDGSFLEDVETLENRPPRDMDVVTFFHLPAGQDQRMLLEQYRALFEPAQTKAVYAMDAYPVVLGKTMGEQQVNRVAYWYSMWSHRRDGLWKGFVQVDLNPAQDAAALALLNSDGGVRHD